MPVLPSRPAARRLLCTLATVLATAATLITVAAVTGTAGGAGGPRAVAVRAAAAPDQVIDANTDPAAAAAALSAGCADLSHCTWQTGSVTSGWGPLKVLGDVLYNCSTGPADDAFTAVGISDARGETTNVSERISVKLQGGLIGLASVSATFTAFTKQAQSFTAEISSTNQVPVQPGWKGYSTSQALSAFITGSTYITDGIHLIEVKDVELTIAGWQANSDRSPQQIAVLANQAPMTAQEIADHCNAVIGNKTAGQPKAPSGRYELVICHHGSGGCATQTVIGPPPPTPTKKADVQLTLDNVVYADGTDNKGRIRLTAHRAIPAGTYTLTVRERLADSGHTANYSVVTVPIKID